MEEQTIYMERDPKDPYWNNQVLLHGKVITPFSVHHHSYGENIYVCTIAIPRLSKVVDTFPLLVPERLMDVRQDYTGQYFEIQGQLRSHDLQLEEKRELHLAIFAQEIMVVDRRVGESNQVEQVFLDGFFCRKPDYRFTRQGKDVTEVMLAVNRSYGKSDYIPCVAWGRNAKFLAKQSVGCPAAVWGRLVSRIYRKQTADGSWISRTVYEVSIGRMEIGSLQDIV